MTPVPPSPVICDRFRSQISLELDGELSQLERAMLGSHLERCDGCRAFRAEAASVTHALRETRLARLSMPVTVRRTRPLVTARLQAAAVAATAFAVVGVSGQLAANQTRPGGSPVFPGEQVVRYPTQAELEHELALLQSPRGVELPLAGKPTPR
jgi:anti-sigma factor RsiW